MTRHKLAVFICFPFLFFISFASNGRSFTHCRGGRLIIHSPANRLSSASRRQRRRRRLCVVVTQIVAGFYHRSAIQRGNVRDFLHRSFPSLELRYSFMPENARRQLHAYLSLARFVGNRNLRATHTTRVICPKETYREIFFFIDTRRGRSRFNKCNNVYLSRLTIEQTGLEIGASRLEGDGLESELRKTVTGAPRIYYKCLN